MASLDGLWWSVSSDTGRESAFTRQRHVLVTLDPYSGFATTACGRAARDVTSERTMTDLINSRELDGIEPNLCSTCLAVSKKEVPA